jgi:hypothetical protein
MYAFRCINFMFLINSSSKMPSYNSKKLSKHGIGVENMDLMEHPLLDLLTDPGLMSHQIT